jgi:hypothetical protein
LYTAKKLCEWGRNILVVELAVFTSRSYGLA